MYGSLITKELKKKYSSKLVGGAERSARDGEDLWQHSRLGRQGGNGKTGGLTFASDNQEE